MFTPSSNSSAKVSATCRLIPTRQSQKSPAVLKEDEYVRLSVPTTDSVPSFRPRHSRSLSFSKRIGGWILALPPMPAASISGAVLLRKKATVSPTTLSPSAWSRLTVSTVCAALMWTG